MSGPPADLLNITPLTLCQPRLPPRASPVVSAIPRASVCLNILQNAASVAEDRRSAETFAWYRLGGEPGAHTRVVYYPVATFRSVDGDVFKCVPQHALLTQVWWRAVARKGACRREELENF
jgi:hypothetical protein